MSMELYMKEQERMAEEQANYYSYLAKALYIRKSIINWLGYSRIYQNPFGLLIYLISKLDGFVSISTTKEMSDIMNVRIQTIKYWLWELEQAGLIKIIKENRKTTYVLGEKIGYVDFFYYADRKNHSLQ